MHTLRTTVQILSDLANITGKSFIYVYANVAQSDPVQMHKDLGALGKDTVTAIFKNEMAILEFDDDIEGLGVFVALDAELPRNSRIDTHIVALIRPDVATASFSQYMYFTREYDNWEPG